VKSIEVTLVYPTGTENNVKGTATYTVRLYFAEPRIDVKAGGRVFDVTIAGRRVLEDFDIARETGGPRRGVVKEFENIRLGGSLTVEFSAKKGSALICGVQAMIEE